MKNLLLISSVLVVVGACSTPSSAAQVQCYPYFDGIEMQVACNRDEKAKQVVVAPVVTEPPDEECPYGEEDENGRPCPCETKDTEVETPTDVPTDVDTAGVVDTTSELAVATETALETETVVVAVKAKGKAQHRNRERRGSGENGRN